MPQSVDTSEKTCEKCKRVGTQRFSHPSPRSKKWVCDNEYACAVRVATNAKAKTKAKSNGKK
jgi:hypothetical protein